MNKLKFAAAIAALFASASAYAGTVDLFSTPQAQLADGTNGSTAYADGLFSEAGSAGDTTILGGYRDLWVSALAGASVSDGAYAKIGVTSTGALSYSNDSGVSSRAEVQWDGNDGSATVNATGLGNFDLTLGNTVNQFELVTLSADANWDFEIIAYTDATHWTRISFQATAVAAGGPAHLSYIPFDGFTNPNYLLAGCTAGNVIYNPAPGVNEVTCGTGGLVDWTNLGALQLVLNSAGKYDIDLRLDQATTVPEPTTLALAGIGLLGAGVAARRRNKKA